MKSTILLATALFLISAPAPDAGDIAEMTANFIVLDNPLGSLSADELEIRNAAASRYSTAKVQDFEPGAYLESYDRGDEFSAPAI